MVEIREYREEDWPVVLGLFREVTEAGDSYAYDEKTTESVIRKLWVEAPTQCYVAVEEGEILGSYFIRPNQPGRGSHVANGGYMVSSAARGKGIASLMCEHSLEAARKLGYRAMQFNFVISTNTSAVHVWEKFGFRTIGVIPKAFNHKSLGYVDALIMFREL